MLVTRESAPLCSIYLYRLKIAGDVSSALQLRSLISKLIRNATIGSSVLGFPNPSKPTSTTTTC